MVAVIRDHILAAQSRQKSYAHQRRRPLEFRVMEYVLLKVSPMKEVQQFGRQEKLDSGYIGPFRIIEHIGAILYRLDLLASMSSIHDVFHVSILNKHLCDEEQQQVLDALEFEVHDDLTTIEIHVCILAN
ncbi:uncharacterized protein LOC109841637 [Asparagus officinalis]|uniref:uncharacterized protein LOC109841637 n=1 Tax=Asparagus officinalis TaxID=4686 RepID=UPI00098E51C2|nr:uncharacterized protein LOC109841637 [Asparagus officinalis]